MPADCLVSLAQQHDTMKQRLGAAAVLALSQLHSAPAAAGRLGLHPALALAGGEGATACSGLRARWFGGSQAAGSVAGIGGMAAAEAAFFSSSHSEGGFSKQEEELGDLRPGGLGAAVPRAWVPLAAGGR